MSYGSLRSQLAMALDGVRGAAYRAALARVITPESVVLDLGAGIGTLGLMAAQLGARRVHLVEPEDVIAHARPLAEANGVADRMVVHQGRIEDVELPERVDVITSAMTGNFLLQEDLLPSLFLARDRWLADGGCLLPSAAVMEVVPVAADALWDRTLGCFARPQAGLDLAPLRESVVHDIAWGREAFRDAVPLADACDLWSLDLETATSTDCDARGEMTAAREGAMHGWLGWFRMRLGDAWLSTSPFEPDVHWRAAWLPLPEPRAVEAGTPLRFALRRPAHGDWTWTSRIGAHEVRQSTFFGRTLSPDTLARVAQDARPTLSRRGRAVRDLLAAMDGSRDVQALARGLHEAAPDLAPTIDAALAMVRALVREHGAAPR